MAATKEVQIIARYAHKTDGKLNGTVTYLVRASNGVDTYCTTLIDGKASGCSCPARSNCYHKTQLETAEWTRYRREVARKLAEQYMTVETVEQIAEQLVTPAKVVTTAQPVAQIAAPKCITDISKKGTLNGARSAALLMELPSRKKAS